MGSRLAPTADSSPSQVEQHLKSGEGVLCNKHKCNFPTDDQVVLQLFVVFVCEVHLIALYSMTSSVQKKNSLSSHSHYTKRCTGLEIFYRNPTYQQFWNQHFKKNNTFLTFPVKNVQKSDAKMIGWSRLQTFTVWDHLSRSSSDWRGWNLSDIMTTNNTIPPPDNLCD